jgi:hypothetical protein
LAIPWIGTKNRKEIPLAFWIKNMVGVRVRIAQSVTGLFSDLSWQYGFWFLIRSDSKFWGNGVKNRRFMPNLIQMTTIVTRLRIIPCKNSNNKLAMEIFNNMRTYPIR